MRRVELEHVIRAAAAVAEDAEFAELAIRHGLVDPGELRRRLDDMPLDGPGLASLHRVVDGAIARSGAAGS